MPICVFDIFANGHATAPTDTELTGAGTYRWWHFDLGDPDLPAWLAQSVPTIPAEALLQPETRPRCDLYEDGLILNLRGINMNDGQPADQMVSVRMWVAQDVIVTVRVRKVFAIDAIRQDTLNNTAPVTTAAFLLTLSDKLTTRIQGEVASLAKLTEFYEADLEDTETPTPLELRGSRRSLIKLRRYLDPQNDAMAKLAQTSLPMISENDALGLREIANRTTIAVEELAALHDRIVSVQEEHDMHIAQTQAAHGYRLSLVAGIFLPLGFLTGVFGMNLGGMPGVDAPWAFGALCLIMLCLAVVMVLIAKRSRWL